MGEREGRMKEGKEEGRRRGVVMPRWKVVRPQQGISVGLQE